MDKDFQNEQETTNTGSKQVDQQKQEEKNPFEGQLEIKIDYQLSYKDLFEGFSLINLKRTKSDILKKILVVLVTLAGLYFIYTGKGLPGIIIATLGFYFVLRDVVGPVIYRHRISKIISKRKDHYTARFYPTGVRITEKENHTNILYSDIAWTELTNVHALDYKGRLVILPKRYLDGEIENILTLAKRDLIDYKKISK